MIDDCNSSLNIGNTCLDSIRLIGNSIQAIIQRMILKPNVQIKHQSNIFVILSTSKSMIRLTFCIVLSMIIIIMQILLRSILPYFQHKMPSLLDNAQEHLEISKNITIKNHLLQIQEVQIALFQHLNIVQATHKKFTNCLCYHLDGPKS